MAGGVGPISVKSTSSIVAHGDFFPEIDHGNTFCKVAHPRRAGWKRKPLEHNGRQTPEWPIWSAGGESAVGLNCRWNSTYDNGCWSAHGGYRSPRLVLEAQWWWQSACVDTNLLRICSWCRKEQKAIDWGHLKLSSWEENNGCSPQVSVRIDYGGVFVLWAWEYSFRQINHRSGSQLINGFRKKLKSG